MKKVMFMIVGMLFAVSVNAATITITDGGGDGFFASGTPNGFPGASAVSSIGQNPNLSLDHSFSVNVDTTGNYRIEWDINPDGSFSTADFMNPFGANAIGTTVDFVTTILLTQGDHIFSIANAMTGSLGGNIRLSVSAVPIPAALFLFAPALLGFFGLRRKAAVAA